MSKATDVSKRAIKDRYRKQAEAGPYDDLPEFKELCCSKTGFDPVEAMACLGHHNTPVSRSLQVTIKELTTRWSPALKPVDEDEVGGGGREIVISIAPWATSPAVRGQWEQFFLEAGWIPPEGYVLFSRDDEDDND